VARGIEQDYYDEPDEVDHGQFEASVPRRFRGRCAVKPVGVTEPDQVYGHREPVDERKMEQVEKQGYTAKDEERIQERSL
jgi:hypothetical protein